MWFGLLGPLYVAIDQRELAIHGARQRALLAGLLTRAGQAVPQDQLSEFIWDGAPPVGGPATLRSYVARLRRSLGPDAGTRVVTHNSSYLIEADDDEVDLIKFTQLCREGQVQARCGSWQRASDLLNQALALWRGEPLADVPCRALRQAEVPRLQELRLQALERRIAADMYLGRHVDVIAELRQLAAANLLRENLQALLMLALYRASRQADALSVYSTTRRHLVDELGIEPGWQLRDLHQRILAHDPILDAAEFQIQDWRTKPLRRASVAD
jgi:DNA-binding SARP family transcriptional activator